MEDTRIFIEFMLDDNEWYGTQTNDKEVKRMEDVLTMDEIAYLQIGSFYIKKEHLKAIRIG